MYPFIFCKKTFIANALFTSLVDQGTLLTMEYKIQRVDTRWTIFSIDKTAEIVLCQ